jgi:hypothetical protein
MLATATSRLERAFHNALDTYYRLKRGNTQVIRVEKLEVQPAGRQLLALCRKVEGALPQNGSAFRCLTEGSYVRSFEPGELRAHCMIVAVGGCCGSLPQLI